MQHDFVPLFHPTTDPLKVRVVVKGQSVALGRLSWSIKCPHGFRHRNLVDGELSIYRINGQALNKVGIVYDGNDAVAIGQERQKPTLKRLV